LAAQTQRLGHVVFGARPFELVDEPQPLLRVGQRQTLRPGLAHQPSPGWSPLMQLRGQLGHTGSLKQSAKGKLDAHCSADTADQTGSKERVPAQRKEVVLDTYVWNG